jgi:hypothetical protein
LEEAKALCDQVVSKYKGIAIVMVGTEIPLPLESGNNSLNVNFEIQKTTDITADFTLLFEEKNNGTSTTEREAHRDLVLNKKADGSIALIKNKTELAVVNGQNIEMTVIIEDLVSTFRGLRK